MKKLIMLVDVDFAHRGVEIVKYTKGQEVQTDDDEFVAVVLAEKWGEEAGSRRPPSNKARGAAPENK